MSKFALRPALLALSLSAAFSAHAADNDFSYRFSGFGTLGYAQTDSNDVLMTNGSQLKGADKSGSFLLDSRLGGQLDLTFNPRLSATVQAIALQDAKGKFRPRLEWAFVRYNLTNDVSVRVGQLGWPAYLVSDFRYVGYANNWLRPPLEVYNLAALDNFQGADVDWTHSVGSGYLTLKVLGGHAENDLPDSSNHSAKLRVNSLMGAYATYEIGNLRMRGGISTGKVSYTTQTLDGLYAGLDFTGFGDVTHKLALRNSRTNFASIGATYDANNVMITGEYADRRSSSLLLGHSHGWYVTGGYRFGNVMPYVTYAGYYKRNDSNEASVPMVGPLVPLSVGVQGLVQQDSQHDVALGARWDLHSNIALKAQVDHVMPSVYGGTFTNVQPGYHGQAVNVYSAVVDFVF
ncbi:porin [Dyella ginsengisoli]|uniref:porin n=1 Tax=Dyella ginsengisoli TaxID=363848 RepID=UPI000345B0A5|nr:porin [Dyella ginsengisoli]